MSTRIICLFRLLYGPSKSHGFVSSRVCITNTTAICPLGIEYCINSCLLFTNNSSKIHSTCYFPPLSPLLLSLSSRSIYPHFLAIPGKIVQSVEESKYFCGKVCLFAYRGGVVWNFFIFLSPFLYKSPLLPNPPPVTVSPNHFSLSLSISLFPAVLFVFLSTITLSCPISY